MTTNENGEEIGQMLITDEIKKYSSFVLDENITTDGKINNILRKLLDDYHCGFDSDEENVRILNFISYLYWRKRDGEKSHYFAEKAKVFKTKSLVALNNAIIFHYDSDEISQYNTLMEYTVSLRQDEVRFKQLKALARAEIAYCYSRMGPEYHEKAEHLFRKAIDKIFPKRNYLWEFGLAITLRRQANIFAMRSPSDFKPEERNHEAIFILERITEMSEDRQLAARAWVELGVIMAFGECNNMILDCKGFSSKECFHNALLLCPRAYFVLQRYGQHLRYIRKFNESKEILEKSISIQDTQFARHHLALTLTKLVLKGDSNGYKVTETYQSTILKKAPKSELNFFWGSKLSISSPKTVQRFPNNPLLKEAVDHLEKALKMNEDFDKARYDLGLTYRYLDEHKEALKCFSRITSARWGKSSEYKVIIINAYEQQGICSLELAEMATNDKEKTELKTNGQRLLWKSLEVASLVIKTLPYFKETNAALPTLKELLTENEDPRKFSKEMARLYDLVHDHDKATDLCHHLLQIDNTDSFAIRKVVQEYVRLKDFDNAIHTLLLLRCTKQSDSLEKDLYLTTFLEGAKYSYENGDDEEAKLRFIQAYNVASYDKECKCLSECNCCDVFVFCVEHLDDVCACKLSYKHLVPCISSMLGINVLFNDTFCLGGTLNQSYMIKMIEEAKYIMPIINGHPADHSKTSLGCLLNEKIELHREKVIPIIFGNNNHSFKRSVNVNGESCAQFDTAVNKVSDLLSNIVMEMSKIF